MKLTPHYDTPITIPHDPNACIVRWEDERRAGLIRVTFIDGVARVSFMSGDYTTTEMFTFMSALRDAYSVARSLEQGFVNAATLSRGYAIA